MSDITFQEKTSEKTHEAVVQGGGALKRYQNVMVGDRSILFTIYYEFCIWMSGIPGALGLLLRKIFWPRLFNNCGKGVTFGEDIILRHPRNICISTGVVIGERCILDGRSDKPKEVINIGSDVMLANDVVLSCKYGGEISIGSKTGIGAQTIIHSVLEGCAVQIGHDVLIGPKCYLIGGGTYNIDRLDIPFSKQGKKNNGPVILEDNIWLGGNVTVIGGVKMGKGSIAAAGAVVTKDIPPNVIAGGIPAKVLKIRGHN